MTEDSFLLIVLGLGVVFGAVGMWLWRRNG